MPELALVPPPPRAALLRELRRRLGDLAPGVRIVAEDLLGGDAPIDFVGVEPSGRALLVLVGEDGEDRELMVRALAQRAWVEPRLRDWLQLAPELGLRPELGGRCLLLCPSYRPETLAAVRALGAEAPDLARYHCVRSGAGLEALLEPVPTAEAGRGPAAEARPAARTFRTGLTDADLDLSPDERRAFG